MRDEKQQKKKKGQVVVRGESSRRLESSGAAPNVGVSPFDQFPTDPPIVRLLAVLVLAALLLALLKVNHRCKLLLLLIFTAIVPKRWIYI